MAIQQDKVNFRRLPHLNNLELLQATYVQQHFAKHMHECFAIGVIERGVLKFHYRGENWMAPAGSVNLAIPGEAHDGSAGSKEGWTYRMFYLDPLLLAQAVHELSGIRKQSPSFTAGIIQDAFLAEQVRDVHRLLEVGGLPLLEQEERLFMLLTLFISRHADHGFTCKRVGKEPQAVKLARGFLEENYTENVSVKDLARRCHLSPFHFIRVFKAHTGIPPYLYLKQVRMKKAKVLLAKRLSIAAIAHEIGFTDQSHFSRQFKQMTGITPHQYSNIIQDLSPERSTIT